MTAPLSPGALSRRVKETGRRVGFDLVAVGPAGPPEHGEAFVAWLDAGRAGIMAYLHRERAGRLDPQQVLPGVRSVVACALNYHQGPGGPAHVARYAWGDDYHDLMKPRLQAVAADLRAAAPGSATRAYVDTGPVLERDLAARAGLGWIGKNTMLLHPGLGSFFFIGVVLATAELLADAPLADRCGTCTRCLEACPTEAFVAPYVLDARRCLSYLTIEHRGPFPEDLRERAGSWAFGCDLCQDVCPWNRRAPLTGEAAFAARPLPSLVELVTLDEATYRERLRGSPLRRAGRPGLARNAAVALAGVEGPEAVEALARAAVDPEPLVREHAAWSLARRARSGAGGRPESAVDTTESAG